MDGSKVPRGKDLREVEVVFISVDALINANTELARAHKRLELGNTRAGRRNLASAARFLSTANRDVAADATGSIRAAHILLVYLEHHHSTSPSLRQCMLARARHEIYSAQVALDGPVTIMPNALAC